jgi:hypothetical protein
MVVRFVLKDFFFYHNVVVIYQTLRGIGDHWYIKFAKVVQLSMDNGCSTLLY